MRLLKVLEPIQPLVKDAALLQPVPEVGTLLKAALFGQNRTLLFKNRSLDSLPSIMADPPASSNLGSAKATLVGVPTRVIGTLNPHRLEASDFMELANATQVFVRRRDADTQGFLYMSLKPGLPPLSSQIRFRLMPSADPTQFEKGTDLLCPNGQPWNLNMLQLTRNCYAVLKDQMHRDGYTEVTQSLSGIPPDMPYFQRVLCYLEQPFVLDVSQREHSLTALCPNKVTNIRFQAIFYDSHKDICPYTGRLVLRFERSTLPVHTKGNFVVLRVLKILDPIKCVYPHYDGRIPEPLVDNLLISPRGGPRAYNLDRTRSNFRLETLPSIPDDKPDL
ncbi:hypothetical protein C0992_007853 [Termitomyces sp. T32_za158]|nr:hypothetical protein C0992_007853 [Termitomyces sp. T32_za158]